MKLKRIIYIIYASLIFIPTANNTYGQKRKFDYSPNYEILLKENEFIQVSKLTAYKGRFGIQYLKGGIGEIYDYQLYSVRKMYKEVPVIRLNHKGVVKIRIMVSLTRKEIYEKFKSWLSTDKSNDSLLKEYNIDIKAKTQRSEGSITSEKKNRKLTYRGYSSKLFCKKTRVCEGGYYKLKLEAHNGSFTFAYKGVPLKNDELIDEFYNDKREKYQFGINAYNFEVNVMLNSLYEHIKQRKTQVIYHKEEEETKELDKAIEKEKKQKTKKRKKKEKEHVKKQHDLKGNLIKEYNKKGKKAIKKAKEEEKRRKKKKK